MGVTSDGKRYPGRQRKTAVVTSYPDKRMHRGPGLRGAQCAALKAEDAAYLAGFIDGEGHIGLYWAERGKYGCALWVVAFCVTDREVLDWTQKVTGLRSVHEVTSPSVTQANYRTQFTWRCTSVGAATLLEQTLPYMRITSKVLTAEHVIRLQADRNRGRLMKPADLIVPGVKPSPLKEAILAASAR